MSIKMPRKILPIGGFSYIKRHYNPKKVELNENFERKGSTVVKIEYRSSGDGQGALDKLPAWHGT